MIILSYVFYAIWIFLPAGAANAAPVWANKIRWLKDWQAPLDFGKTFRGKRLFGQNKTWRGLFFGCLAAGCCWGTRCDLPWAITFTNPEAHRTMGTPLNVPLHPAQLYQSAAEFAIFAILWRSSMRPHVKGSILAQFLMLEGIARFVVELFREHQQGNLWLGLDTSQCLSIALILTGIAAFRWDRALARPKRP